MLDAEIDRRVLEALAHCVGLNVYEGAGADQLAATAGLPLDTVHQSLKRLWNRHYIILVQMSFARHGTAQAMAFMEHAGQIALDRWSRPPTNGRC